MKRPLLFAVLALSILLYYIQNDVYRHRVFEYRASHPSNESLEKKKIIFPGEILEEEDGGILIRVSEGAFAGKKLKVALSKEQFRNIEGASHVLLTVNENQRQFTKPKNHAFDYDRYLFSMGIDGVYRAEAVEKYREWKTPAFLRRGLRKMISERIEKNGMEGLLSALILGEKKEYLLYDLMKRLDISHLLVISGLHFSILHRIAAKLFGWFGNRYVRAFTTILIMSTLFFIVSSSYSAQRAYFTMLYLETARLLDKKPDLLTTQSLALGCILLMEPRAILSAGLHLSFYTYFSVAFLYRRITSPSKFPFYELLKFSFYVQFATLPITCSIFGTVNLFSAFANAVCVPFLGILVPLALFAVIFAPVPGVSALWRFLEERMSDLVRISPLRSVEIPVRGFDVFVFVLLMFALVFIFKGLYRNKRYYAVLVLLLFIPIFEPDFEIVNFDVGHGDSTLVRNRGMTVLVDTGDGKTKIAPELRYQGIHRLDFLIVTHAHKDHIGGLKQLMYDIEVDYLVLTEASVSEIFSSPEELQPLTPQVDRKNITYSYHSDHSKKLFRLNRVILVRESEFLSLRKSGVEMTVNLHRSHSEEDENDNGLVALINTDGKELFFFGDASDHVITDVLLSREASREVLWKRGSESGLADSSLFYAKLEESLKEALHQREEVFFLKAPHHGSSTSVSAKLYTDYYIRFISVSHSHKYRLPAVEFLDRVCGETIYSTYLHGIHEIQ